MRFDVQAFREQFPQLQRKMGPRPLIYFDSGASTLKHQAVTQQINAYNRFEAANVHRGSHQTSRQATESYERARQRVQSFIKAHGPEGIIFTKSTTEGINFIASSLASVLKPGDEILISPFEHHSNIVPWQVLSSQKGLKLKVIPFHKERGFTMEDFKKAVTSRTRLLSLLHYSNSFGNRFPIEAISEFCQSHSILSLFDCAQSMLTERLDVEKLGCDFLVFSGHKMYGPNGIGVLSIHRRNFKTLPPYQTGGSMIDQVSFEKTTYGEPPHLYEAGTPNISGAIGLGVACQELEKMDYPSAHQHVLSLRHRLLEGFKERPHLEVYDFVSEDHTGVLSFNRKQTHPSDMGTLLDKYGFALRAGHHCTQPLMNLLGLKGTLRVSLAHYNSLEEVESFLETIDKVEEFF